jgi:hypothetical protein
VPAVVGGMIEPMGEIEMEVIIIIIGAAFVQIRSMIRVQLLLRLDAVMDVV